jgi:DNA-binding response OmpR family regulator
MDDKILVVDDDPGIVRLISKALDSEGYGVDSALDGESALELAAEKENYALIICNITLPQMSGFEFLNSLTKVKPDTPIIIISGHTEFGFVQEALHLGAVAYLVKPYEKSELLKWVNNVMAHEREDIARDRLFDRLITEKHEMILDTATLMKDNNCSRLACHFANRFIAGKSPNRVWCIKIRLAVHEALRNSVEHGNLDLSSTSKPELISDEAENKYEKLMKERLEDPKYAQRKIFFKFSRSTEKAELTIRDEGKGFDHRSMLKAQMDAVLAHGRGLMMIRAGVDEMSYNEAGNEITLTCYLSG